MSSVGKLAELVAAAHWDLGLDFLGLHEGLDSLSTCTVALVFLASSSSPSCCISCKVHDPQELGVHHLKRLMSLISRCCFCAVVGTVCAWCGSWTWPCLHWGLQILKHLGPDKKESGSFLRHISCCRPSTAQPSPRGTQGKRTRVYTSNCVQHIGIITEPNIYEPPAPSGYLTQEQVGMACSILCQKIPRSPGLGITNVIDFLLEEVNPDSSLEGLLLKLKLQYFGHLMQS